MSTDSDGEVDLLEIKASLKNDAVKEHDLNLVMITQIKVHKIKANI